MDKDQVSAAPADREAWLKEATLMINQLILMASGKASQPAETPPEDRITDADIDALEAALLAHLRARPAAQALSEEQIIQIAKATKSAEPGCDGYVLPISFARAIERALLQQEKPADAALPADPCPHCERGGTCEVAFCGRKRSSELMRLYGTAGAAPTAPAQQCMEHGECFGGECIYGVKAVPADFGKPGTQPPLVEAVLDAGERFAVASARQNEQNDALAATRKPLEEYRQDFYRAVAALAAGVEACPTCNGRGWIETLGEGGEPGTKTCPDCNGSGRAPAGSAITGVASPINNSSEIPNSSFDAAGVLESSNG
jgi:hypothetical protein